MSLPLVPPPQLLAVDDVLPVEIIEDADTGWQDLREHIGVEHFASSAMQDSKHRVVTVPKAIAFLEVDTSAKWNEPDRFREVLSLGFSSSPQYKALGTISAFTFSVPLPWYGIKVAVRSADPRHSWGWARVKAGPDGGVSHLTDARAIEAICIAVYGDK